MSSVRAGINCSYRNNHYSSHWNDYDNSRKTKYFNGTNYMQTAFHAQSFQNTNGRKSLRLGHNRSRKGDSPSSSVFRTEDKRSYRSRSTDGIYQGIKRTPSWYPRRFQEKRRRRSKSSSFSDGIAACPEPRKPRSHSSDTSIGSSSYSHSLVTPTKSLLRYCESHVCNHKCSPVKSEDDHHMHISSGLHITERYRIVDKVGEGTFGRVVRCLDLVQGNSEVAVKVVKNVSKYREAARLEIRVLDFITKSHARDADFCIRALDWFNFHGHICIVFELLGPSVFEFMKSNSFYPFSLDQSRHIGYQLVCAVDFLHSQKITHTDLKPENILFVNGAAKVHYSKTTKKMVKILISCTIKIIDFGSATFSREHHTKIVQTRHYRAPEVILELTWDTPCDVWSIGCILFEIYTGKTLFMTHDNIEHLVMMEKILQRRLPSQMVRRTSKQKYFKLGGLHWSNFSDDGKYVRKNVHSLRHYQRSSDRNHRKFFDVIDDMLEMDPQRRSTLRAIKWRSIFDGFY